jgi:hypothetical protein
MAKILVEVPEEHPFRPVRIWQSEPTEYPKITIDAFRDGVTIVFCYTPIGGLPAGCRPACLQLHDWEARLLIEGLEYALSALPEMAKGAE